MMPMVDGKKFPYTQKGMMEAKEYAMGVADSRRTGEMMNVKPMNKTQKANSKKWSWS
jgi:hypothetical protein